MRRRLACGRLSRSIKLDRQSAVCSDLLDYCCLVWQEHGSEIGQSTILTRVVLATTRPVYSRLDVFAGTYSAGIGGASSAGSIYSIRDDEKMREM